MHGLGIFYWPNGQVFKGFYQHDKKEGKGELKLFDGTVIKGKWKNGKLEGMSEVRQKDIVSMVRWH